MNAQVKSTAPALLGIVLISVLLRLGAAVYLGSDVLPLPGIHDQISYHTLATRLLGGHGFTFAEAWWPVTPAGEPTAHWSYLYTGFLYVLYSITGVAPLIARIVQVLAIGILMPVLVYRIASRVFNNLVALVAALWVAVYGYFIYYSAALMTESFYIVGILWVLDNALLLIDRERENKWQHWLMFGVSLGITALLRQVFLLFAPFLFAWILLTVYLQRGDQSLISAMRKPFMGLFASGLIMLAFIIPVTIFNYGQFDHLVLLNTNSGYALFWGNHPVHEYRFVPIFTDDMPTYQELIPQELLHLNEAQLDSALREVGSGFITDNPGRYLMLCLTRIPAYFQFWYSPQSSLISNIVRMASLGIALPFMLLGLFMWGRGKARQKVDRWQASLLVLFAFIYTLAHIMTWALVRYRLPVDAVLLPFAAFAIVSLLTPMIEKSRWAGLKQI